jgi:hypothetical protein
MSAEQLTTLRYEDLIRHPAATAAALSDFVGDAVGPVVVPGPADPVPGAWQRQLTSAQVTEIESVAGPDLRRVGYGDLTASDTDKATS